MVTTIPNNKIVKKKKGKIDCMPSDKETVWIPKNKNGTTKSGVFNLNFRFKANKRMINFDAINKIMGKMYQKIKARLKVCMLCSLHRAIKFTIQDIRYRVVAIV